VYLGPAGQKCHLPFAYHIHRSAPIICLEADVVNLLRQAIRANDVYLQLAIAKYMDVGGFMVISEDREVESEFAMNRNRVSI
jgi:hypothetical protein